MIIRIYNGKNGKVIICLQIGTICTYAVICKQEDLGRIAGFCRKLSLTIIQVNHSNMVYQPRSYVDIDSFIDKVTHAVVKERARSDYRREQEII